jgi:hypothetical protein
MKHPITDMAPVAAHHLGENVIYLMGLSFVLGSLFTILVLLLLDFMRRNAPQRR